MAPTFSNVVDEHQDHFLVILSQWFSNRDSTPPGSERKSRFLPAQIVSTACENRHAGCDSWAAAALHRGRFPAGESQKMHSESASNRKN